MHSHYVGHFLENHPGEIHLENAMEALATTKDRKPFVKPEKLEPVWLSITNDLFAFEYKARLQGQAPTCLSTWQ